MLLSEKAKTFRESIGSKLVHPDQLRTLCEKLRREGKSIVTLNGSFDLLHPGHLEMIYQASCQGDVLLMLLNTDASIKVYKSPDRPINPLEVRLQHIAALQMVGYVSWFSELDPIKILAVIKPDIHCNGSEYGENCIEAPVVKENGGRIHIIQLIGGYSSTNMIKKIKSLCD